MDRLVRAVVALFPTLTMLGGLGQSFALASGAPQPFTAQLQQVQQVPGGAPTMIVDGRPRDPAPLLLAVNQDDPGVSAFSLDATRTVAAGTVWRSLGSQDFAKSDLSGKATALWIASGGAQKVGAPLTTLQERSAEQMAIWSFTNATPVNKASIPEARYRTRVQQIVAAAPTHFSSSAKNELAADLSIARKGYKADLVQVLLDNGGPNLAQPQRIQVTVTADHRTLCTGSSAVQALKAATSSDPPCRGGSLQTNGLARFEISNTGQTQQLTVEWESGIDPLLFLADARTAPLVTAGFSYRTRGSLTLQASDYLSLRESLAQGVADVLGRTPTWLAILLLLVGLYLLPKWQRGVDGVIRFVWRKRPGRSPEPSPEQGAPPDGSTPKGPSPGGSST